MNDRQIIDQVIAGDIESYSLLVEKYKNLVLSIVFQVVGNREDAEEITQDVFVKAFLKLKTHRRESKFPNWIYRIALNTSLSKKRKLVHRLINIEDSAINITEVKIEDSLQKLLREERDLVINQAVEKLNLEEKLLISLKYYNDCSIEDIAEITGKSESNIKTKLFRIRKRLYSILNPLIKQYQAYVL